jgi:hypothetical protein
MTARRILSTLFERMRPTAAAVEAPADVTAAPTVLVCRTHDEVNADLARSWCDANGMEFRLAGQRDPLLPEDACALVLDVHHLGLDAGERAQFLERLCRLLPPYPVAVASYDLDSNVKNRLLARGCFLFRHLKSELFYQLAAAIWDERACRAVDSGSRLRLSLPAR